MLINLSNHPLATWEKLQIEEANKCFGEISDIPFPHINPIATEEEISTLTNKYFNIITNKIKLSTDKNNAVHIMGELTFVFSLVNKLLNSGITCVASTTERSSKEANGKKISEFNFVKFREYKI